MCISEFTVIDDTIKYRGNFCEKCSECLKDKQRDETGKVILVKNWDVREMCNDFYNTLFSRDQDITDQLFCSDVIHLTK